MWKRIKIIWDRVSDLSTVQWLFPSWWTWSLGLVMGGFTAAFGWLQGLPFIVWIPVALCVVAFGPPAIRQVRTLGARPCRPKSKLGMLSDLAQREPDHPIFGPSWMPLHEALRYLVYDSRWAAAHPSVASDNAFDEAVSREFRERLARGEVEARGKLGIGRASLNRATEPIPSAFWIDAFVQPHGEIALRDDDRCAVTQSGGDHCYRAVIVRKSDLEAAWPARVADGRLTALATAVEPLRRKIASENAVGTDDFMLAFEELTSARIPFVRLRQLAADIGIPLCRYGAEQNNGYHLEGRLRQAAVDGAVRAWGRQFRGPVRHNDPLIPIPAEHFRDYGFGHGDLDHPTENESTRTEDIRMLAKGQRGIPDVTFYDIHLTTAGARDVLRKFQDWRREKLRAVSARPESRGIHTGVLI